MSTLLSHAPLWVWALLALLIRSGVAGARPNSITTTRLFLLPIAFTLVGAMAVGHSAAPLSTASAAVAGLIIGAVVGWRLFARLDGYAWDDATHRLTRPATWLVMVISLSAFLLKFGLASAIGWRPELLSGLQGALLNGAVTGATSGLLWGACVTQLLLGRTHVPFATAGAV